MRKCGFFSAHAGVPCSVGLLICAMVAAARPRSSGELRYKKRRRSRRRGSAARLWTAEARLRFPFRQTARETSSKARAQTCAPHPATYAALSPAKPKRSQASAVQRLAPGLAKFPQSHHHTDETTWWRISLKSSVFVSLLLSSPQFARARARQRVRAAAHSN